ncbi:uncharacterized protein At4g38062 [Cannabis sativa]|uniref:uncharacterized protein At4g38062 n=1 Tax=Cannabis sativa TaxID=3483 RepID=UPI0029CA65D9|nr:uncharacterized protein At4g38062 [Cannabis sativa]
MNTERVYEELDEAKAEVEKLRVENKSKTEVSENLKRSYNEQLKKAQAASSKIEKQAEEINDKAHELSVLKQRFEDVQCSLNEKESIIRRLNAANEKIRVDCDDKFRKWEEENKGLILALEKANEKNVDQEQLIHSYKEQIEVFKGSLSVSQKKCFEVEKNAKGAKEAGERENVLFKLEEDKRKIEEQLKWKKEQFTHLEEAHRKMRDQFKASQKEWELEKNSMIDEIDSLQTRLDSQTRISEDFQDRLQTCTQALAHEESRRKYLEVQFSEVQSRFDNVFNDYQDAKSQLECFTEKRNEEIASLRHALDKKEILLKEMEYQKRQMEQEMQEVQFSLKELQEALIQKASGSPSVAKLRNKLKCSEQMHKESTAILRAKEAELKSQLETLTQELEKCGSQLESKDTMVKELRLELEQVREDFSLTLRTKEGVWNSQLEKAINDLSNCMAELESRDETIKQLRVELKQIGGDSREHIKAQEADWMNQLENKDAMLKELRMELEQTREDFTANLKVKEDESNSQLEKVTTDLSNCRSVLASRDATIKELKMEIKQIHGDSTANIKAQEAEWKCQLEMMAEDLNMCRSQLESKDEKIKKLKMEVEQMNEVCSASLRDKEAEMNSLLENVTSDLNNCRSELDGRDAMIEALRMELESLRDKEAEMNSLLENVTSDLNNCRSELDSRDAMIEALRMELESLRDKEDEMNSLLENVTSDLNNCRSELDGRDAMIEALRMELESLRDKEAEMNSLLENVTSDLNNCRSELDGRDAMIKALRMELEETKGDFLANFQAKEAQWRYQLEMMTGDLNKYRSQLNNKDARLKELETNLEECHCLSLQQNEEISVMLLVLKEAISEAQMKFANGKAQIDQTEKENKRNASLLMQQLEMKNSTIERLQKDIEKEHENVASLLGRVERLDAIGQQQLSMQKDLERYEEMIMELSVCEIFLREQILQVESVLKNKLREVCIELDRTHTELAEKICEGNEIEFELYIWRSAAKGLLVDLEENYEIRKELEASLLAEVDVGEITKQEKHHLQCMLEQKDDRIYNLQHQVELLEQNLKTREAAAYSTEMETAMSLESEKASLREKDKILEQLQREVEWLEQESLRRELEEVLLSRIEAERTVEHEKELMQQKNQRINELMQLVGSFEDKLNSSFISFSSELSKKQAEINLAHEAWEKITAAQIMAAVEIEEKKLMVAELEDDIHNVEQKLELQQNSMYVLKKQAFEVEAELEAKELEIKDLSFRFKTKLKESDALIEELKSERKNLLEEITNLSSERENLLGLIEGLSEKISEISSSDKQLMDLLETTMPSTEDEHSGYQSENVNSPIAVKKLEANSDRRSPFREINY